VTLNSRDARVRERAFDFLADLTMQLGDVLPYLRLRQGFDMAGERVPLLAPQGIFKPRILDLPLSIATAPNSPYNDAFGAGGLLQYRYRGTDPMHRDNVGLREVMKRGLPLVYLYGIVQGSYLAAWPVYIVNDSPATLTFTVAVDDKHNILFSNPDAVADGGAEFRRKYITSTVRVRLHQRTFRARVLAAYRQQCSLCQLRHTELLDAAHIIPDADEAGEPVVSNGLALCNLHHAAFDRNILGIRPDYVVEIRTDILDEIDGPMLKHGLQEMHGRKIRIPRQSVHWPNPEALAERYDRFRFRSRR
jgi:putative restriction endonuclease